MDSFSKINIIKKNIHHIKNNKLDSKSKNDHILTIIKCLEIINIYNNEYNQILNEIYDNYNRLKQIIYTKDQFDKFMQDFYIYIYYFRDLFNYSKNIEDNRLIPLFEQINKDNILLEEKTFEVINYYSKPLEIFSRLNYIISQKICDNETKKYKQSIKQYVNVNIEKKKQNEINNDFLIYNSKNESIINPTRNDLMVLYKNKLNEAILKEIKLNNLDLSNSSLINSNLSYSIFDHINFEYSNLSNANFSKSKFNHCIFNDSNCKNINLIECIIDNCSMENITLEKPLLDNSTLNLTKISNTKIINSDYQNIKIYTSNINNLFLNKLKINDLIIKQTVIEETEWDTININNSIFDNINIISNIFKKLSIIDLNLSNSQINKSNISEGNITKGIVENCNISETQFNSLNYNELRIINNKFINSQLDDIDYINIYMFKNEYYKCLITNCIYQNSIINNIKIKNTVYNNCKFYECYFYNSQIELKVEKTNFNYLLIYDSEICNSTIYESFFTKSSISNSLMTNIHFKNSHIIDSNYNELIIVNCNLNFSVLNNFNCYNTKINKIVINNTVLSNLILTHCLINDLKNIKSDWNNNQILNSELNNLIINDCNWNNIYLKYSKISSSTFNKLTLKNVKIENSIIDNLSIIFSDISHYILYNNYLFEIEYKNNSINDVVLNKNYYENIRFSKCSINNSVISNSQFINCELIELDLYITEFSNIYLENSKFNDIEFNKSSFNNINFNNSSLENIDFSDMNMKNIELSLVSNLKNCKYNSYTEWNDTFIKYSPNRLNLSDCFKYFVRQYNSINIQYFYVNDKLIILNNDKLSVYNIENNHLISVLEFEIHILDLVINNNVLIYSYYYNNNYCSQMYTFDYNMIEFNQCSAIIKENSYHKIQLLDNIFILINIDLKRINIYKIDNNIFVFNQELNFTGEYLSSAISTYNKLFAISNKNEEVFIYEYIVNSENNKIYFSYIDKLKYRNTKSFGYNINISEYDNIIGISSYDPCNIGIIHLYYKTKNKWIRKLSLTSPNPDLSENFGYSLSFDLDYLLIGSPYINIKTSTHKPGKCYIYGLNTNQLIHLYYTTQTKKYISTNKKYEVHLPFIEYSNIYGYWVYNSNKYFIIGCRDNYTIFFTKNNLNLNIK